MVQETLEIYLYHINESPPKHPDIKTPLVVSFSLSDVIHFSRLAAF